MKKYVVTVDESGTMRFYKHGSKCSILNREDGPACEYANGNKEWWLNGQLHREDGPAVEWADGDKYWYLNDLLHREDGPAIEHADGEKQWWLNGKLHREDGPAYEGADGSKDWYLNDENLSEAEFNSRKNSCQDKIVEIDGKKYKLTEI